MRKANAVETLLVLDALKILYQLDPKAVFSYKDICSILGGIDIPNKLYRGSTVIRQFVDRGLIEQVGPSGVFFRFAQLPDGYDG
ncbi:MAG TPA: hypothetical protein VJ327_11360 [Patescibacteria group bacterium]|nr:hypothetical protein [Patescibacteria group bacterium]